MTTKKWRWMITGLAVAAAVGTWSNRRAEACLLGSCDAIIIANQVTQIGHMVAQIREMGRQLGSINGVLNTTTELITSDDVGMGNIGRVREAMDERLNMERLGEGLSAVGGAAGAWNQRIPGVTDAGQWLDVLAAPRLGDAGSNTVLLAGMPATETTAAEPSAFRSWSYPGGARWARPAGRAAREAIDVLGDVAEGTATWRTVWDDIEAALPPSITAADLRGLRLSRELTNRIIDVWRRTERLAGASLQHTHAVAESTSTLGAQVGETAAHQGALRDDNLENPLRVEQAVLSALMSQTELRMAQAQVQAQERAQAVRERYEAERLRRERVAAWMAEMAQAQQTQTALATELAAAGTEFMAGHRYSPSTAGW